MKRPLAPVGRGEIVAVAALLTLGVALRFWRLDLGWFGVDQARDIQTALDIAAGRDWPTVGPTMRRVTSLGALYYYVWSLPHLASDDPLASYRFAAGLGVVTLIGVWMLARRWWGSRPALLALAVVATSPIAVIDSRIAWAPAALPAMAVLLLWLLAGSAVPWRLGVLGAALGVAVQLHLAMVAWVLAAVLLVLMRRPSTRAFVAGGLGAVVTGFPAAYAALLNAGHDAGLATLPARGPLPNVLARLWSAWSLEWRVPAAFWQWPDAPDPWPLLTRIASMLIGVAAVLGLGRLAREWRCDGPGRVLLTVGACQLGMVVLLPGEAWYYYLDALLPLIALAAGALVASGDETRDGRLPAGVTAVVLMASLLLAVQSGRWLTTNARHGYVVLQPAALTLDGSGGRDASAPGRLLAVGVKRDVAMRLATEPADFATRWRSVHGPACDDVTGDNGFWLTRASSPTPTGNPPPRHTALWYRDDPTAPTVATAGVDLVDVGPLRLARYVPAIAYETCRTAAGPVAVPIRVVPAPRRYGDGTTARTAMLPRRIECALAPGSGGRRLVAAVTAGAVEIHDAAGRRSAAGATTSLCVTRGARPTSFTLEILTPPGAPSDLDLYERPDPDCDAEKIAP